MRRRDEVAVGILLTLATIILLTGTIWLVRGGLSRGYPLHARFGWGQSLKQGQPVLLAGVTVGSISDVKFRNEGFLDVDLRIENQYKVPHNATARVKPVGIFGDVAVALEVPGPSEDWFAPGDTIPAGAPSGTIEQLTAQMDTISRSISRISRALETELVQAGMLKDLRRSAANAAAFSKQLQEIADEQNRNLTETLNAFKKTASAINPAMLDSATRNVVRATDNIAHLAASLDTNSARATAILSRLQNGEGSAGKLLSDTLLYQDTRRLVTSIDSLINDFKKNPKKYINLRIF
jgi:phospholipid/cholesterol/gamma-HCH transport system substrate-binding protein